MNESIALNLANQNCAADKHIKINEKNKHGLHFFFYLLATAPI